MRLFALLLPAAFTLAACGAQTAPLQDPAALLVGEWEQVSPVTVTQRGSTLTFMDGEMEFAANGTTESDTRLSFDGEAAEIANYAMTSDGTWTMSGNRLVVGTTALMVTPITDNPQSRQMARGLTNVMSSVGTSTLDIVALDADRLTLRDPNTGVTTTYRRD